MCNETKETYLFPNITTKFCLPICVVQGLVFVLEDDLKSKPLFENNNVIIQARKIIRMMEMDSDM